MIDIIDKIDILIEASKPEEFNFSVKKKKGSFYNEPDMVGHQIAKERVDQLDLLVEKLSKTRKQKILLDLLINFKSTDWHYFNNITKKDIQTYSYILRRIDKKSPLELYLWHEKRSGVLKDRLTHILEYLSYMSKDKNRYMKYYIEGFKFYGLPEKEAKKRFEKYHKGLEKYDYIKELKRKWK